MKTTIQVSVQQESISLITNITYKMESYWYGETQRPLKMSLLLPKHKERHTSPLPLVVWFCGGAFQVVDKDIWLPQLVPLARQGFIVASAEYRTINDAPLPASIIDARAAIRYLKAHAEQYLIDPDNIFVMGESAGAVIASMMGVLGEYTQFDQGDFLDQSVKINGAIDFYGSASMVDRLNIYKANSSDYIAYMQKVDGTDSEKLENMRRYSPIEHVCQHTVPFLIFHGTSDEKVHVSQSDKFYDKLTACGVPCDYYRLDGCRHGVDEFYQPEIMDIILEFLKKHTRIKPGLNGREED